MIPFTNQLELDGFTKTNLFTGLEPNKKNNVISLSLSSLNKFNVRNIVAGGANKSFLTLPTSSLDTVPTCEGVKVAPSVGLDDETCRKACVISLRNRCIILVLAPSVPSLNTILAMSYSYSNVMCISSIIYTPFSSNVSISSLSKLIRATMLLFGAEPPLTVTISTLSITVGFNSP